MWTWRRLILISLQSYTGREWAEQMGRTSDATDGPQSQPVLGKVWERKADGEADVSIGKIGGLRTDGLGV